MDDEELLGLYASDQEERQQFYQLHNETDRAKMRVTLQANDAKRRDLVDDLMPCINNPIIIKTPADYFRAAYIFSRGDSVSDRKKAQLYAKKAYSMVMFKQDHLAEQIRNLYAYTTQRLMRPQPSPDPTCQFLQMLAIQMTTIQRQCNLKAQQKKKRAQEKELKRLRKCPRCFTCGRQHEGPCPSKAHKKTYTMF